MGILMIPPRRRRHQPRTGRARSASGNRRCASRRSPMPGCRLCSKSLPPKSQASKKCSRASMAGVNRQRRRPAGADCARRVSVPVGTPVRGANMKIQQMMKQAQQAQERLQKHMSELRAEGNAGGGMVTVVVNGAKQIQSLKIDPEVVSKDDVEMLQDLIVAAVNDAQRKADEEMAQKMAGMLPPGMKL